ERERTLLDTVLPEPRLAKDAGVLGLRDALLIEIHREVHIVAHAPAERAGGVPDDLQVLTHHPDPPQSPFSSRTGSTSTSRFLEIGMPLPAVSPAISWLDSGPYVMNRIPGGRSFVSRPLHRRMASPAGVRNLTLLLLLSPRRAMSSTFISRVDEISAYAAPSLL